MASFKQALCGKFSSVAVSKLPVSKLPSISKLAVGLRRCPIGFSMEQRRPSMTLAKKKKRTDQETEPIGSGEVPSCKQPLINKVDEELCLLYSNDVMMFATLFKEVSHQYDAMKLKTNLLHRSPRSSSLQACDV